jgi:hypothetical protein
VAKAYTAAAIHVAPRIEDRLGISAHLRDLVHRVQHRVMAYKALIDGMAGRPSYQLRNMVNQKLELFSRRPVRKDPLAAAEPGCSFEADRDGPLRGPASREYLPRFC